MAFIHTKLPCPKCPSSDAYAIDDSGWGKCFSCGTSVKEDGMTNVEQKPKKPTPLLDRGRFVDLKKRGIDKETCRKFGYHIGDNNGELVHIADYRDSDGNIVSQKVRNADKDMWTTGKHSKAVLFGQHLWGKGTSKRVVVTEGEIDCLTVSQLQGNSWPVVSVPTGSSGALAAIKKNIEFLDGYDEIVIMFDNDAAGDKAAKECLDILPIGKGKKATLPLNDPNDMLLAGRGQEVIKAIWNAKEHRPDGIVSGKDLLPMLLEEDPIAEYAYPFDCFNKTLLGIRPREVVTLTSGSGMGKSQLTREIAYSLMTQGAAVGYIALEEGVKKSALGMLSLAANKQLHLLPQDNEERQKLFNDTLAKHDIYFYDHFGSLDGDNLIAKIRYLVVGMGCKYIFLDHISIMVSGIEDGDERRIIDNMMTKLRTLTEELGCGMFIISHLKRPKGDKGHEEGAQTSLAQLRGSAAIAQLSDAVIGLERNQQSVENGNTSTIRVLKNRISGNVGLCGYLSFNKDTGRMFEVEGLSDVEGGTNDF